jgi:hypothetical protein
MEKGSGPAAAARIPNPTAGAHRGAPSRSQDAETLLDGAILHDPRRCPACQRVKQAVRDGTLACAHQFEDETPFAVCTICLNERRLVGR